MDSSWFRNNAWCFVDYGVAGSWWWPMMQNNKQENHWIHKQGDHQNRAIVTFPPLEVACPAFFQQRSLWTQSLPRRSGTVGAERGSSCCSSRRRSAPDTSSQPEDARPQARCNRQRRTRGCGSEKLGGSPNVKKHNPQWVRNPGYVMWMARHAWRWLWLLMFDVGEVSLINGCWWWFLVDDWCWWHLGWHWWFMVVDAGGVGSWGMMAVDQLFFHLHDG